MLEMSKTTQNIVKTNILEECGFWYIYNKQTDSINTLYETQFEMEFETMYVDWEPVKKEQHTCWSGNVIVQVVEVKCINYPPKTIMAVIWPNDEIITQEVIWPGTHFELYSGATDGCGGYHYSWELELNNEKIVYAKCEGDENGDGYLEATEGMYYINNELKRKKEKENDEV
jgi:hypothetical protein